jgi:hypothetical protein
MVPVPGYHIDMYIEDDDEVPESLKDFVVPTPDNPVHRLR